MFSSTYVIWRGIHRNDKVFSNRIMYFEYRPTETIAKLISYKFIVKKILSDPAFFMLLNSSESKWQRIWINFNVS